MKSSSEGSGAAPKAEAPLCGWRMLSRTIVAMAQWVKNLRRRTHVAMAGITVAIGAFLFIGCGATVTPPANPADPVTVYLVDHGKHPSLLLPLPDGNYMRYVYGDWAWYALGKADIWHGIAAMCWPTPSALGRRELSGGADPIPALARSDFIQHVYVLRVARADSDALRRRLDGIFAANQSTYYYNAPYELEFVRDPSSYTILHNCNQVMKKWLQELGCEVSGPAVFSAWKINAPETAEPARPPAAPCTAPAPVTRNAPV